MSQKSKQRQKFLLEIIERVERFKHTVETPIIDEHFLNALYRAEAQGQQLIEGIQDLVDHAVDLRVRIENSNGPKLNGVSEALTNE